MMNWTWMPQGSRRNTRNVAESVLTKFFGEPVKIKDEYVRDDCDQGGKMWAHEHKIITVDTLKKDSSRVYMSAWAEGKGSATPVFGGDFEIGDRDDMFAEATAILLCNNLKNMQIAHDGDGVPYIVGRDENNNDD